MATTKKQISIVLNGREATVEKDELTYDEVTRLAHPDADPLALFTVTYRRGRGNKPEGSLIAGQTLKVKKDMIINAIITGKS